MKMKFAHVSIRAKNMDQSIEFYSKYFDMKLDKRREIKANNAEIAFLSSKGTDFKLELTHYRNQKDFDQTDYEDRSWDHLAFEVDDMKELMEKIKKDKVTVTDEPFKLVPGGPLIAFIEDPVGVLIELIERA
jgi:lactoylglutathione lyase